jgi:hypothetical protein
MSPEKCASANQSQPTLQGDREKWRGFAAYTQWRGGRSMVIFPGKNCEVWLPTLHLTICSRTLILVCFLVKKNAIAPTKTRRDTALLCPKLW